MKDTFYFSHDYNARQDPKLQNLMMVHGLAGIGAYWCIIELLYEQNGRLKLDNIKMIAYTLHCKVSLVESLINDFDLFQHDDTYFWSESVCKRTQERFEEIEKRKKGANKRWEKNNNKCEHNASILQAECEQETNVMQANAIKGKERKGKEIIKEITTKKNAPRFSPPTKDDVKAYIQEKGYSFAAERFFDFYESKGWYIGKNKMKDWKAAVRNWARGENTFKGKNNQKPQSNTQCNEEWQ